MIAAKPRLRVAFLTPEYPSERDDTGGLASYLRRMTRALIDAGHDPEVFTLSQHPPSVLSFEGVRVERVAPAAASPERWLRVLGRLPNRPFPFRIAARLRGALGLAAALEHRQREAPFDVVQSSNFELGGVYVPSVAGRVHLVRCSGIARFGHGELSFLGALRGGFVRPDDWISERVERRLFRRVDAAYAPSDFVARFYRDDAGVPMTTVRPPFVFQDALGDPPPDLPPRYFAFISRADRSKGVDLVARATAIAAQSVPDVRVVGAGSIDFVAAARRSGAPVESLRWVGPLRKPALYAFARRAVAVVAMSRYDNLPNAVIEALMLGVPVIGSRGASIDELVDDGETGELVAVEDERALAAAMVRAWRGEGFWSRSREWTAPPGRLAMLEPERATGQFLDLVSEARTRRA